MSFNRDEAILDAMARMLGMPNTRIHEAHAQAARSVDTGAQIKTKWGTLLVLRGPDGNLDNCARAHGERESECQVCGGACPDRARFAPK